MKLINDLEKSDNFTLDEILFNVLIDSCIRCRKLNLALEIFDKMRSPESSVTPDEVTFNTIIKGCALNKMLDKAFTIFESMSLCELKANDVTYNSIIDACVRCGKMDKAWSLFVEMQDNGITPDNFTFSTLIKGIKRTGNNPRDRKDLDRAFNLLEQIKANPEANPDEILYNCLIDACIRLRDINRAVAVFNEM